MEANKEEALRCLERSKRLLESEAYEAALRMARKAARLYPCADSQTWLEKILAHPMPAGQNQEAEKEEFPSKSNRQQSVPKPFTEEQAEAVSQIKQSKDYYEVLAVERNANDLELKKAYRKVL